jgi:putative DNA primase/helicase
VSFKDIALPLVARGISVIPVQPGEKRCLLKDWPEQATLNESQIEFWDRQNPDYNVGCVGKLDSFAIMDCDVKGLGKRIETETGQKFPETLIVRSAGKGTLHVYLRHTERSRALGNRTAPSPAGGEWFSLRADNEYVVGPGSKLIETGKTYDIVQDCPIADFPDWLCDWIKANSPKAKKFEGELAPVNDDFDIEEMLEHYDITYVQQGNWYNCYVECPVAGYQHQQSKMPGFFFDGNELGFNCWAAGCPSKGMNAGKVIKHLNETHEPYPKLIWPEAELDSFDVEDIDDQDEPIENDDPFLPPPKPAQPVQKIKEKINLTALMSATQDDGSPPTSVVPVTTVEEVLAVVDKIGKHDQKSTYEFTVVSADNIPAERKVWLWEQRIPANKITLFSGKGERGKSTVAIDLAARVSRGADWPDGAKNTMGPRKVLMLATEDDPADTIIPNLIAAGADCSMIKIHRKLTIKTQKHGKEKKTRRALQLKEDIAVLQQAMKENPDFALIVMDPITGYFGDVNVNADKEMRPLMEKLQNMCAAAKVAVIAIIHYNKNIELDSVQRIGGAGSVANVPRAIWNFASDPENEDEFLMSRAKGNTMRLKTGMRYKMAQVDVPLSDGTVDQCPRIEWLGTHDMNADAVDQVAKEASQEGGTSDVTKIGKARLLISAELASGKRLARELYALGEKQDIGERTMQRACRELRVVYSGGKGSPVYWSIPNPAQEKDFKATLEDVADL